MSAAGTRSGARPFDAVLIANRGEIAVRVIAACREAGLRTIAVYSEADRDALHTTVADEAYPIGPAAAAASYLNPAAILAAAHESRATAIHPGYGFLSENAAFAQAVLDAGLVWIGPPPAAIAAMGDKVAAKHLMAAAGVPLVPGYDGEPDGEGDAASLQPAAEAIGFPVLIKAAAGGGGRGMRVVERAADFGDALAAAQREAGAAFGDARVFLEKYLVAPRHIEIQVLADTHGQIVHLGERECSIQRRHQKVLEEAPSPAVSPELRARMGAAAVAAARAVEYVGAGTVEFLLDADNNPYFLEMNTRLQVEHPITEAVTGTDLVRLQLAIAAGEPLPFTQDDVALRGHAIECRIYAEDPIAGFLPASGTLRLFAPPTGPGIRNDFGVATGDTVGVEYDPQLAKLIVHAPDRAAAIDRLAAALRDYAILGVTTNLPFLGWLVAHPKFRAGQTTTAFIEREWSPPAATAEPPPLPREVLLGAAALDILDREERAAQTTRPANPWQTVGAWRAGGGSATLRLHHGPHTYRLTTSHNAGGSWTIDLGAAVTTVTIARRGPHTILLREGTRTILLRGLVTPEGLLLAWQGRAYRLTKPAPPTVEATATVASASGSGTLTAPMPGKIIKLHVAAGDHVAANQPLLVLEAMKMEHTIAAPHAGTVRRLPYPLGATVAAGAILAEIDAE
jgi:3-methylcrotonyl-CoA carboxylase alpha subunit